MFGGEFGGDDFNQSPFFRDVDLFSTDAPLVDAVTRAGLDSAELSRFGKKWGAAETLELGRLANENLPRLRRFDAKGDRIDLVEYHPSYHALMATSSAEGLLVDDPSEKLPASARAARFYVVSQVEAGHLCPVTMTHAAPAATRASRDLHAQWSPKMQTRSYDPSNRPWWEKSGVTVGMGMTERQGGSDVRSNRTFATPVGEHVEITGHKWVPVRAYVRRVPRARADRGGTVVLPHAALPTGRNGQFHPLPTPQG